MARAEKTIHYLYKTTCIITGRYYIGMHSTSNLNDGYMGSGKRLRYSIRKYGKENHIVEILEFFENRELLVEAEIKAITVEMITDNNCMNIAEGGCGGHGSRFLTKEQMSKGGKKAIETIRRRKENDDDFKQKLLIKISNGIKKAIKEGRMGTWKTNYNWVDKKHSEETKKLMSKIKKGTGTGETNSQYGTCWITKDGLNKKIKKEDLETYLLDGWVKGRK